MGDAEVGGAEVAKMSVVGTASLAVMVDASGEGITVAVETTVVPRAVVGTDEVETTDEASGIEDVAADDATTEDAVEVVVGTAAGTGLVLTDVACWVD